jgi:hypothetical protein
MSVIITFMFEPAKLQMNWARASGARNLRREAAEPADPGSSATGRLHQIPAFSNRRARPTARGRIRLHAALIPGLNRVRGCCVITLSG